MTILRRELAVRYPEPRQVEESVAVTYSTETVPPRIVHLPMEAYRQATAEELSANPRYSYLPASPEGEQRERKAIEQDVHQAVQARPTSFQL